MITINVEKNSENTLDIDILSTIEPNSIVNGIGLNMLPGLIIPKYLEYVVDLNFDYVRTGTPWNTVETVLNTYDWSYYDTIISNLEKYNIKPLIEVGFNNTLYGAEGCFTGITTLEELEGFIKFTKALINRYKGRCIIWEIWNEPNIGDFWSTPDANDYAVMTKYTLQKIRETLTKEIIIAGALARPNSGLFIEKLAENGVANLIDGLSIHCYRKADDNWGIPESLGISDTVSYITTTLQTNRVDGNFIPVIVSEMGFPTAVVTEEQQAQYLARLLVINKVNNVPVSIIHNLVCSNGTDEESNYGIINYDLTLRPAYNTLKQLALDLKDATFTAINSLTNGILFVYEFEKNNKTVIFAWTTGENRTVTLYDMSVELTNSVKVISIE